MEEDRLKRIEERLDRIEKVLIDLFTVMGGAARGEDIARKMYLEKEGCKVEETPDKIIVSHCKRDVLMKGITFSNVRSVVIEKENDTYRLVFEKRVPGEMVFI